MRMNIAFPDLLMRRHSLWLLFFLLALVASILPATGWLTAIPGDLGDARFNSVILEHVYQYLTGHAPSLWSPTFFYPFEGALAFSDNHFGSFLSYALARGLGLTRESAYLVWFILGSSLNFFSMYYVLRKFGFSQLASAFGALIFAVGLPTAFKSAHAQLVYRFAVPLALLSFWRFFRQGRAVDIFWLAFWASWQFLCSIYIGVFLFYLLLASFIGWCLFGRRDWHCWLMRLQASWRFTSLRQYLIASVLSLTFCVAVLWMLYQYMSIGGIYGFERSPSEVRLMLPRLHSYLHAPLSLLYSSFTHGVSIPMGHEHQMFIGLFAGAFLIAGMVCVLRGQYPALGRVSLFSLAALIGGTLYVHGQSLYNLLLYIPGISSIRAVSRIVLVMLVPASVLVAIATENSSSLLRKYFQVKGVVFLGVVIAVGCFVELFFVNYYKTPISAWESRRDQTATLMPQSYDPEAIIYVSGDGVSSEVLLELDGMILAQERGLKTLNGYSGNVPVKGWEIHGPCVGFTHRLDSFKRFARTQEGSFDIGSVKKRVLVLDALGCETLDEIPHALARDIVKALEVLVFSGVNGEVNVRITNTSRETLPRRTLQGPIRLSWRIIPDQCGDYSEIIGWDPRMDFPGPLAAGHSIDLRISPELPTQQGSYVLQVSLVHEGVFWFHDVGLQPGMLKIDID